MDLPCVGWDLGSCRKHLAESWAKRMAPKVTAAHRLLCPLPPTPAPVSTWSRNVRKPRSCKRRSGSLAGGQGAGGRSSFFSRANTQSPVASQHQPTPIQNGPRTLRGGREGPSHAKLPYARNGCARNQQVEPAERRSGRRGPRTASGEQCFGKHVKCPGPGPGRTGAGVAHRPGERAWRGIQALRNRKAVSCGSTRIANHINVLRGSETQVVALPGSERATSASSRHKLLGPVRPTRSTGRRPAWPQHPCPSS